MDNWTWTDELVLEFARYTNHDAPTFQGRYTDLEQFKQSKQKRNKDWEIVMFKDLHDSATPFRTIKDRDNSIAEGEMLNSSRYEIQSVRRRSDNEVFSVGDKCNVEFDNTKGFSSEITSFYIKDNIVWCVFSALGSYSLRSIKKAKQKLFTTLDGKDIYEGDEYWILFIESGSSWIPSKTKASEHTIADVTKSYMKRFSTEELAKEYAIMNKPCLSLNEIKWWVEKYFNYPDGINTNQLKHIVEEKINNGER